MEAGWYKKQFLKACLGTYYPWLAHARLPRGDSVSVKPILFSENMKTIVSYKKSFSVIFWQPLKRDFSVKSFIFFFCQLVPTQHALDWLWNKVSKEGWWRFLFVAIIAQSLSSCPLCPPFCHYWPLVRSWVSESSLRRPAQFTQRVEDTEVWDRHGFRERGNGHKSSHSSTHSPVCIAPFISLLGSVLGWKEAKGTLCYWCLWQGAVKRQNRDLSSTHGSTDWVNNKMSKLRGIPYKCLTNCAFQSSYISSLTVNSKQLVG